MSIKEKIKKALRSKPRAYFIFKILKGDDKGLLNLVDTYHQTNKPILIIENENSDESDLYYMIYRGVKDQCYSGFFAMVRETMRFLSFADDVGISPIVYWGSGTLYYDEELKSVTDNVFEYYFEPVTMSHKEWLKQNFKYIEANGRDTHCVSKGTTENNSYAQSESEINAYAKLYSKYFRLNDSTLNYLKNEISTLFKENEHVLGVHVRGTDYKYQANNHPEFQGFQVYADKVKEILECNFYDKVFLATDDEEALDLFVKNFGDKLVYYKDCARGTGKVGAHIAMKKKPHVMGLEILRDVYTLVSCEAFVCGLSQVSFAVRYIKKSTGMNFRDIGQVQMKINANKNHPYKIVQKEMDEAKKQMLNKGL